jgi:hypothetical protein
MCLNVRVATSARTCRDAVHGTVLNSHATIIHIQEIKLNVVDDMVITRSFVSRFIANNAFLLTDATQGRIISF